MGSLTQDQLDTISKLHQLASKENFIEKLSRKIHDDAQYRVHVWRKVDYSLWNSSLPYGACGWYTVANLHRRAHALPLLDFFNQGKCNTGVDILKKVASKSSADTALITKFTSACHRLSSDRLSTFLAHDQLSSIDFVPLNGDINTAIFMTPPYIDSPRMQSAEWILLYHHTASPHGSATPT